MRIPTQTIPAHVKPFAAKEARDRVQNENISARQESLMPVTVRPYFGAMDSWGSHHPDSRRFRDIIKGKNSPDHLLDHIMNRRMKIDQQGKVSFPMPRIDLPTFRHGSGKGNGGTGSGDGEVGDQIGKPKPGQKPGKPGDKPGEGEKAGEGKGNGEREDWGPPYTPSEIAKLIGEQMGLPYLEPKGKGKLRETVEVWNAKTHLPPGRRLIRDTLKRAYSREISKQGSSARFNPLDVAVEKPDIRRLSWNEKVIPKSKTVIFYIMDVSGSVSNDMKEMARTNNFLLSNYLKYQYGLISAKLAKKTYNDKDFYGKGVEEVFLTHTEDSKQVTEEEFYSTRQSGGTKISSAYLKAKEIIDEKYPPDLWNVYIFQYSDGDNISRDDNTKCVDIMKDFIKRGVRLIGYCDLQRNFGGSMGGWRSASDFGKAMGEAFKENQHVRVCKLDNNELPVYKKVLKELLTEKPEVSKP